MHRRRRCWIFLILHDLNSVAILAQGSSGSCVLVINKRREALSWCSLQGPPLYCIFTFTPVGSYLPVEVCSRYLSFSLVMRICRRAGETTSRVTVRYPLVAQERARGPPERGRVCGYQPVVILSIRLQILLLFLFIVPHFRFH